MVGSKIKEIRKLNNKTQDVIFLIKAGISETPIVFSINVEIKRKKQRKN